MFHCVTTTTTTTQGRFLVNKAVVLFVAVTVNPRISYTYQLIRLIVRELSRNKETRQEGSKVKLCATRKNTVKYLSTFCTWWHSRKVQYLPAHKHHI
jgi:hypothetical protein